MPAPCHTAGHALHRPLRRSGTPCWLRLLLLHGRRWLCYCLRLLRSKRQLHLLLLLLHGLCCLAQLLVPLCLQLRGLDRLLWRCLSRLPRLLLLLLLLLLCRMRVVVMCLVHLLVQHLRHSKHLRVGGRTSMQAMAGRCCRRRRRRCLGRRLCSDVAPPAGC